MHTRRTRWIRRLGEGLRELGRTPVRFAFHLATARLITQWRSLVTIIAGTVLSASIGALVPLYTTAIAQVGMTQRLDDEPARDVNITASISLRASTAWPSGGTLADQVSQSTALVRQQVRRDLGAISGWVDRVVFYGESEAMGVSQVADDGSTQPLIGIRTRLGFYEGWEREVRVVEGRLPQDDPAGVDMELAVGLNVANEVNLEAGEVVLLDQGMDQTGQTGGGHPTSQPIRARIVGIITPLDDESAYWMDPSPLRLLDKQTGSGLWDDELLFLTTEDALYRAAIDFLPDTPNHFGWRILFAHDNLPFSRIDTARAALRAAAPPASTSGRRSTDRSVAISAKKVTPAAIPAYRNTRPVSGSGKSSVLATTGPSAISRRCERNGAISTASAQINSASIPRSSTIWLSHAPRLCSMAISRRSLRRTSAAVTIRKNSTSAPTCSSSSPNGASRSSWRCA